MIQNLKKDVIKSNTNITLMNSEDDNYYSLSGCAIFYYVQHEHVTRNKFGNPCTLANDEKRICKLLKENMHHHKHEGGHISSGILKVNTKHHERS
jgi:hypothetical protein